MHSKKWILSHDEFKVSSAQIAPPHFHSKIGPALLTAPAPSGSLLEIIMQMTVHKCFPLQHWANLHCWCSASVFGIIWIIYTTLNSIKKQAWVSFNSMFLLVWLHIWLQKQITTPYLVQASVSPSTCQNAPHRSLAQDEGLKLIQLRAGSPILLQCFSLSARICSCPLIAFLFAFLFSFLGCITLSWQHWQHFCSQIFASRQIWGLPLRQAFSSQSLQLSVRQTALLVGLCVLFLLRTNE